MQLRPYQEEALDAIDKSLADGISRQLIVLPTGGGKTVVFSQIPKRHPGRMLVLAHREELLHQAKEKIEYANPSLSVGIEQAGSRAAGCDVVVASTATLGRESTTRLTDYPRDYFTSVVVDEAHHAQATTYQRILDYFDTKLRLGVTATPQRSDKTRLTDIFDDIVYFKSIEDLIADGYLCDLVGYRIDTNVDISKVATRNGDYAEGELARAINVEPRNLLAVDTYKRFANDKKALVFCAGVDHAASMNEAFQRMGIPSDTVTGKTPTEQRKEIIAKFKTGEIKVLTNVGVFTEGFDEPSVECIILARPTQSSVLYTQIVGRGTRLHPGKEHCLVLDLADATKGKKPVGLPTLMGLPPDFDSEGEALTEVAAKYRDLLDKLPNEAARARSVSDIADAWSKVDLFRPPPPNPELLEYTTFVWMEAGEENYLLNLTEGERLTIKGDALGRYSVHLKRSDGVHELGVCDTMEEAFRRSDRWVRKFRSQQTTLLDHDAEWRKQPPTDGQLKYLRKHGVPITSDLTKGQASQILDKIFAEKPRPKTNRPAWLEQKIAAGKRKF